MPARSAAAYSRGTSASSTCAKLLGWIETCSGTRTQHPCEMRRSIAPRTSGAAAACELSCERITAACFSPDAGRWNNRAGQVHSASGARRIVSMTVPLSVALATVFAGPGCIDLSPHESLNHSTVAPRRAAQSEAEPNALANEPVWSAIRPRKCWSTLKLGLAGVPQGKGAASVAGSDSICWRTYRMKRGRYAVMSGSSST